MIYSVWLTRAADKDLSNLKGWKDRVGKALKQLKNVPYAGHTLSGALKGARALEFSLPGGEYRAAYLIKHTERECVVFMVGPHENFYREAERRLEALRKTGEI